MKTRLLDKQLSRVETGPISFGDDWTGVFIRGDNALYYAECLESALNGNDDPIKTMNARGLIEMLRSSDERGK